MDPNKLKRASKFLSLVLRHKPETISLSLDRNGWATTAILLHKFEAANFPLTMEELIFIVNENDKKRFSFSENYSKIRANQGHSLPVELDLSPTAPPEILYHGTALKNLDSIKEKGILKRERHHVHLSTDKETASKVGMRYGKPVVLTVKAGEMQKKGISFYLSRNGVWLTDHIAPQYIHFPHQL